MFDNLVAFSAIFIASILMKYVSGFDAEVGSYIYLPIGVKILVFLLFGSRVLPGVLASCVFCGIVLFDSWGGNFAWGAAGAIMGAISPLIAIFILGMLKVSDFSNLKKIDFRHIILLILFTAIIHALSKFIIYAKSEVFSINPVDFLSHYLIGDMIGGIVVILAVLKIAPYLVWVSRLGRF
ncbi:MAG: MASE1 domain-containing protein [Candidatus Thioglobus sp.]|nr:MASE1 domain-containing protein [Candidatus Thioglobus sp.]